ncbi:MurR/RpiR family transcriptional regulator [Ornithinibacillus salinisoli]
MDEQHSTYSKSFQKVASYFYRNPNVFALNSAMQASKEVGVSETTIIRFCHKLGYKGYSDLQQEVQSCLLNRSSLSDYVEDKDEGKTSIKNLMLHDIHNIQKVIEQISEDDLDTVVTKLSNADRILVSGVRSSHALANWFAFALDLVIGKTRFFQPNIDDVLLRLSEVTTNSVFVAFSFHRYAVSTIQSAKLAKQQGAFVVSISDSKFAPIADFSDLILPIRLDVKSTLDAAPIVFSLMNSIVSTISLRNPETFQKRVEMLDAIEATDFFAK